MEKPKNNKQFGCSADKVFFNEACKNLPSPSVSKLNAGSAEEIEKRFGAAMLSLKYKHKPDTVIMVDINGDPMGVDNGDGTWSGFDIKLLYR